MTCTSAPMCQAYCQSSTSQNKHFLHLVPIAPRARKLEQQIAFKSVVHSRLCSCPQSDLRFTETFNSNLTEQTSAILVQERHISLKRPKLKTNFHYTDALPERSNGIYHTVLCASSCFHTALPQRKRLPELQQSSLVQSVGRETH